IDTKADGSDGPIVTQEGYSWEGAEASVDTGTPGPGDQQAAEAQVRAQMAANQAAAESAHPGSGDGTAHGGRGVGRSPKELAPHILKAVHYITGQTFPSGAAITDWLGKNKAWLVSERKAIEEETKKQASEGKADPKPEGK